MASRGLFRFHRFTQTDRHAEVWSFYEKIYTGVDFLARLPRRLGAVLL